MAVRCVECGYNNGPGYRYCGMCGASLPVSDLPPKREVAPPPPPPPPPARPPSAAPSRPAPPRSAVAEDDAPIVSGPSVLGLGQAPSRQSAEYLLEDDEPRSGHRRLFVALLLLIVAAGLIYWRWKRDGYPWSKLIPASSQSAPATTSTATPPATQAPPVAQPAETPAQQAQPAPQPQASAETTTPAPEAPKAAATPENAQAPQPTGTAETETAPPPEKAPAAAPPVARPAPAAKPAEPRKAAATKPAAVGTEDEALAVQGERYLYGNGVAQNCSLALKSLLAAAARSNVRAQTDLGTMYATGHCATRDLPTAYRWFAKALHQDPGNQRITTDLEVIWRQMTPEERQSATRSQ